MPKNRNPLLRLVIAIGTLPLCACASETDLIPKPSEMRLSDGAFVIDAATALRVEAPPAAVGEAARDLSARLATGAGLKLLESSPEAADQKAIVFANADATATLGDEGYALDVTDKRITIRATHPAGFYYGVQTLLQLLPADVYRNNAKTDGAWQVHCLSIVDHPRFQWRGLMLDVSRHFFTKAEVLKLLDEMAVYKLNVLHWHLTDDQGWRIEIKKYPKLTSIGAWRDSAGFGLDPKLSTTYAADGKYGGFYTQDDVREVVAYAAARHIMVVPEIEMPGHATATLRAYPQFATPAPPSKQVKGDAGIFNGVYDPSNPETFEFLHSVLDEVAELFPSPYIHIGGDEVPKEPWEQYDKTIAFMKSHGLKDGAELQSFFVKDIDAYITSKGKRTLGWDEILEGGLAPGAAVMSWRGFEGGLAAAKAGHDVVMTPVPFCYIDGEQATNTEPHERGAVLPVKKVYSLEPIPAGLPADRVHHVLGVQANLWTEYVPNFSRVQYMVWPREAAIAEIGWSPAEGRSWDEFAQRLNSNESRFEAVGANYRPQLTDELTHAIHLQGNSIVIDNPLPGATVRYTLDGTFPTEESPSYTSPVELPKGWVQATALYFTPNQTAVPAAAAQFLDGHAVHLTCTSAKDWETRRTVFYTQRWGGGPNETVTVTFDAGPVSLKQVSVHSGEAGKPETKVENGLLEISSDGTTFSESTPFKDGLAEVSIKDKPVAAFRIKFVTAQTPHPVVTSVEVK